jgi:cyclopropane-fatty-acyl-phospholipid synthase
MNRSIIPLPANLLPRDDRNAVVRLAMRLIHRQMQKLTEGELVVRDGDEVSYFGRTTPRFPAPVHIDITHPSFYLDVAFGGTSGSGEAWMKGSWECSDLLALIRIFLANRHVMDDMDYGLSRLKAPLYKLGHWLSRNTREGSRRNISAHYDIGNELFALFLDPAMMYSSAYYREASMNLDEAAIAKLDLVCRKLDLGPDDHLLEIGTGWGGLAIHAASQYGCRVTTTTISREQHAWAASRIRDAGLDDRITLLLQDYRDLGGRYDKLVSIEMIEAIGHQYLDTYFAKCASLLKPDGAMLLQAITITDRYYASALKDVDFIKKFIFPGGFLPSVSVLADAVARCSDMKVFHLQDIGPHYARTLQDWRQRFFDRLEAIRELGYSDAFVRLWEYYFCYCEGGFLERDIGTVQMLLTRPKSRRDPVI